MWGLGSGKIWLCQVMWWQLNSICLRQIPTLTPGPWPDVRESYLFQVVLKRNATTATVTIEHDQASHRSIGHSFTQNVVGGWVKGWWAGDWHEKPWVPRKAVFVIDISKPSKRCNLNSERDIMRWNGIYDYIIQDGLGSILLLEPSIGSVAGSTEILLSMGWTWSSSCVVTGHLQFDTLQANPTGTGKVGYLVPTSLRDIIMMYDIYDQI